MISSNKKTMNTVPSLSQLCLNNLIDILERNSLHPRLINELCKRLPDHFLEPILQYLLQKNKVTDVALIQFLNPGRTSLNMNGAVNIMNCTLKQIGFNCPNMITLDISECIQVCNAVVRAILCGCPKLQSLKLDRCHRITDAAFDCSQNPFEIFQGFLSLEALSLQGCPQITGNLVATLNKNCRKLSFLNLSQCKHIIAPAIQQIFEHDNLRSLNLAFTDSISDEAFLLLPSVLGRVGGSGSSGGAGIPMSTSNLPALEKLILSKSTITDLSMFRMAYLGGLTEITLQWCLGITDKGVAILCRHCPRLKSINLKSCPITDDTLSSIASHCPDLLSLDISWCDRITDSGIQRLTPSAGGTCHSLESLSVIWCLQLTDASLVFLEEINSLHSLMLSGCSGVSMEGIRSLRNHGVSVTS